MVLSAFICVLVYISAASDQLASEGYCIQPEEVARLSPLVFEHINLLGRYAFSVPDSVVQGQLRPLRNLPTGDAAAGTGRRRSCCWTGPPPVGLLGKLSVSDGKSGARRFRASRAGRTGKTSKPIPIPLPAGPDPRRPVLERLLQALTSLSPKPSSLYPPRLSQ